MILAVQGLFAALLWSSLLYGFAPGIKKIQGRDKTIYVFSPEIVGGTERALLEEQVGPDSGPPAFSFLGK